MSRILYKIHVSGTYTGSMSKPKPKSIIPQPLSNVTPEAEPEPEVEVEPVSQRAGYLLFKTQFLVSCMRFEQRMRGKCVDDAET